jgi:hypothetical protein
LHEDVRTNLHEAYHNFTKVTFLGYIHGTNPITKNPY